MIVDREVEKATRQNLAYAGAGLLLRGMEKEGLALILASQALYSTQLDQVMEALERGDIEEAAWLAMGYTHHPTLEKREVFRAPQGGWRPILAVLEREGVDPRGKGASLFAMAYTAHLGEVSAILAVYERKGLEAALQLADRLLETRTLAFKYGLHEVSGPRARGRG